MFCYGMDIRWCCLLFGFGLSCLTIWVCYYVFWVFGFDLFVCCFGCLLFGLFF